MFGRMVAAVVEKSKEKVEWKMPGGFSGRKFLPWIGQRMCGVSEWAAEFLLDCKLGEKMAGLTLDEDPGSLGSLGSTWLARLRSRTWAVKPGNMMGSRAT